MFLINSIASYNEQDVRILQVVYDEDLVKYLVVTSSGLEFQVRQNQLR